MTASPGSCEITFAHKFTDGENGYFSGVLMGFVFRSGLSNKTAADSAHSKVPFMPAPIASLMVDEY